MNRKMNLAKAGDEKPGPDGFLAGDWKVFPLRNLLVRGEEQVRVEPRVMDVLVCLAERAEPARLRGCN
jgi:hypothetical protein